MPDSKRTRLDEIFEQAEQGQPPQPMLQNPAAGQAPASEPGPIQNLMSQVAGRAPNAIGMGLSGAAMGGPIGALLGGAAGAALPPSDTPGMDMGAVGGEALASMLTGGRSRLVQMAANAIGVGSGALVGSMMDRKPDMEQDTPWGRIGLYVGVDALTMGMGAMLGKVLKPSDTVSDVQKLAQMTGVEVPLTSGNRFGGVMATADNFLSPGTDAASRMAARQSEAVTKVANKLLGADVMNPVPAVEAAGKTRLNVREAVENWRDANAQVSTSSQPTGIFDATGAPITKTTTTKSRPTEQDFARQLGLDAEETSLFFNALRRDTQGFLDAFLGGNQETRVRGLIALRALKPVMSPEDFGALGAGLVMRALRENGGFNCGTACGHSFYTALMSKFGKDKLQIALGKQEADALETLARVVRDVDPARRMGQAEEGVSPMQRLISYGGNKLFFAVSSMGAGAWAGSQVGVGNLVGAIGGGTVGLVLGAPIFNVAARLINNPTLAKTLQTAAERGDPLAVARFARAMMSAPETTKREAQAIAPASTPRTRLDQLFAQP